MNQIHEYFFSGIKIDFNSFQIQTNRKSVEMSSIKTMRRQRENEALRLMVFSTQKDRRYNTMKYVHVFKLCSYVSLSYIAMYLWAMWLWIRLYVSYMLPSNWMSHRSKVYETFYIFAISTELMMANFFVNLFSIDTFFIDIFFY